MRHSFAQVIESATCKVERRSARALFSKRWISVIGYSVIWLVAFSFAAQGQELSNDTLRLRLGVTEQGVPVIKEAIWKAKGQTAFTDLGTPAGLSAWVPAALIPTISGPPPQWTVAGGEEFAVAEASADLAGKIRITWVVELAKQGSLIRLHTRLQNLGKATQPVDWFPVWSANWSSSDATLKARFWRALAYNRIEQPLTPGEPLSLGSRLQSSDDINEDGSGRTPFWAIIGPHGRTYFALEWCGGWGATIGVTDGGFTFAAKLPPAETQLVLGRRETIEGPALWVAPSIEPGDFFARYAWLKQRQAIAKSLYGGPEPSFPLAYNTWYTARYAVDGNFVRRQVTELPAYGIDAFIIDAGWSTLIGVWKADPAKFGEGELESTLSALKSQGIRAGLWSCPQYVSAEGDVLPDEAENPPVFSNFLEAYLSDLAGGFDAALPNHVRNLRRRYSVDWWKYDQPFFTAQSRAGAMRNILAFQNGLRATRSANDDLVIENCQTGGRIINELTLMATQVSWLRDGPATGLGPARENVQVALGALDFMFPWSAYRFTNNFDRMDDPNDDELTRMYCRSAMLGTWGISSDLTKITDRQRAVIVKEIANYRQLNLIKTSLYYDLRPPVDGGDTAGATFYDQKRQAAGVLLFRWDREGAFDRQVILSRLRPTGNYQITDADTGAVVQALGKDLMRGGMTVSFSAERRSALLFVQQIP